MKRLGIIGGMGPEATLDLFRKIVKNTPAKKDQEHIPITIDNYPQIPDRTAFLMGQGENPLPYLLESLERLLKTDVDCVCMPCNTAHYFIDDLRQKSSVPVISIVESVLEKILNAGKSYKKIGLLATSGTFIGKVYHRVFEKSGVEIVDFSKEIQENIMKVIYLVKAGETESAAEIFKNVWEELIGLNFDCLIAGCTEIPLLLPYIHMEKTNVDVFDATEILAKKTVEYCLN